MVERTVVQIFDDLDGSEIAEGEGEEIEFAYRGTEYRLDLSRANVQKLESVLAPYIAAARTIQRSANAHLSARSSLHSGPGEAPAIRAWARENGYEVGAHGRMPTAVLRAYQEAHQS
ncbi:MAG TPA: Lsr2 family protein [Mycobacterium sp.]|nr:Lsr2 family protein [Mycobacterium sp.]